MMPYDSNNTKIQFFTRDLRDTQSTLDLWFHRGVHDFKSRYHHTFFGVLWHTINPVIFSLVISFVFSGVFEVDFTYYFVYVLLGYSVWMFANDILGSGSNIFANQAGFILSQKTPLEGLIIQSLVQKMLALALNLTVAVLVSLIFTEKLFLSPVTLLLTVVLFLQAGIAGFASSLLLSTLSAKMRDIPLLIGNCLRFLFFITPIVWFPELKGEGLRQTVTYLNPLFYAIEMPRNIFLYDEVSFLPFLVMSFLNLFLLFIAFAFRILFAKKVNLWILP